MNYNFFSCTPIYMLHMLHQYPCSKLVFTYTRRAIKLYNQRAPMSGMTILQTYERLIFLIEIGLQN
jgi:hypothetical protein